MKIIAVIFFAFLFSTANAQTKYPYWSVGVNPMSLGESMASIGPCAAYRLSPGIELWAEVSYIYNNLYKINDWKNLHGYRFIFQPRFYSGSNKSFFITPEFRLKQYSYNGSGTFINAASFDTLNSYPHRASQILVGGAIVFGTQTSLSRRNNLFLEITAGIGGKLRSIKRKNIPSGYKYYLQTGGFGLAPHYEWHNDGTPYFPLGFRLIWRIGK